MWINIVPQLFIFLVAPTLILEHHLGILQSPAIAPVAQIILQASAACQYITIAYMPLPLVLEASNCQHPNKANLWSQVCTSRFLFGKQVKAKKLYACESETDQRTHLWPTDQRRQQILQPHLPQIKEHGEI